MEKTVAFQGTNLRYWIRGAEYAPWLVISHGMALDSASFQPLIDRLADRWRIVRWDFPGHGKSGPMPGKLDMSTCVEACETVFDDAGVKRAVLLGFSFGGVVSQLVARRRPERTLGLIAYGCFSPVFVKRPSLLIRWLAERHVTGGDWNAIRARFANLCSINEVVQQEIVSAMAPLGKDGFRKMTRSLLTTDAYDPQARFDCPVMYIRGDQDSNNAVLKTVEDALRKAHPDLVAEIVPKAGHCAHQDNPEAFNAAIERFLARISKGC